MTRVRRFLVTGRDGQVVRSLVERAALRGGAVEIVTAGRPDFDLARPETIRETIARVAPDVIVSAAAYTAVDQAETDAPAAFAVNAAGPCEVARQAASAGVPLIHLSTDYVFDGTKDAAYTEADPVAPLGVYGQSKLDGERGILAETADVAILRTAWVYSPFGKNFAKTMLRLAETREGLSVVGDQIGNPTSAIDIADAVLSVAANMLEGRDDADLRGIFHMTGSGEATWADFAEEIFTVSAALGGPSAVVTRIATSEYPTPARRPSNSRLDSSRLAAVHGLRLQDWRQATRIVVERLVKTRTYL